MAKREISRAAELWDKRTARLRAQQPRSFGEAMRQVHTHSLAALSREVYSRGDPNRRTGNLRRAERLEMLGPMDAVITNDAASEWKGQRSYYAWYVALGRKAHTKASGVYAWMVNPMEPRPQGAAAWRAAVKAGRAVISRKIGAVKGRPWRKRAVSEAKRLIPLALQAATKRAMEEG